MSVAVTSLPVPLSPVMRTVLSLLPMTRRNSNTARMRALLPTTSDSIVTGTWACIVITASRDLKRVELGNLGADGGFDAVVQRHVRRRTAGTHAGEADRGRPAFDRDELDV